MNHHQKYVANLVAGLEPSDVATLIACPPKGKGSDPGADEIHDLVKNLGTVETVAAWAGLLADAAGCPRERDWPATWAVSAGRMMMELPVEVVGDVVGLDRVAA